MSNPVEYYIPQPNEITQREKDDAMGAYFMTFASLGIGAPIPLLSLIAALIYHGINAKKSRFVGFHSLQSLLGEIPISLLWAGWTIWGIIILVKVFTVDLLADKLDYNSGAVGDLTIFWNLLIVTAILTVLYLAYSLYAAFQAKKGRFFYFWIIGPLIFRHYFSKPESTHSEEAPNLPPKGL